MRGRKVAAGRMGGRKNFHKEAEVKQRGRHLALLVFAWILVSTLGFGGCKDQQPPQEPPRKTAAADNSAPPIPRQPSKTLLKTTPATKPDGGKWRIGYYEGGEYINYQQNLVATIQGLMDLGWIEPLPIPAQQGEQTAGLWQWLCANLKSEYVQLVADGHYTADWDDAKRPHVAEAILARLTGPKDIDLMMAMGTWAGKDLANDRHRVPTVVMSTSDPVSAGIVRSAEDSGYDHVHARVDPLCYERQIRIFHDIIGFKRLGVIYENTEAGKSYAAIDQILRAAADLGFELVSCHARSDTADKADAEREVLQCFKTMVEKVDAIYVTEHGGVNSNTVPELAAIANAAKIPTFSQAGSDEVKKGVLLSVSTAGFKYVGKFYAETIARIFNGARPRELDQLFEDPPKIAINLKACELVGFDPPVDVLGAADEIFQEIEVR